MQKTHQNKWMVCMTVLFIFIVPYFIVNHLPIKRQTLPFIFAEESIPFVEWTFIIYFSLGIQVIVVIMSLRKLFLRKLILLSVVLVLLHLLVFMLVPIEYPRGLNESQSILIRCFWQVDASGNCFPSLHVSGTVLLASFYTMSRRSKSSMVLMWGWTIVIIISTLTTKQHYILDILGSIWITGIVLFCIKKHKRPHK